jgi:hypothetical protein
VLCSDFCVRDVISTRKKGKGCFSAGSVVAEI